MDDLIFVESTKDAREDLLRLILELAYKEGDFTLASGKKSDYYIDNRRVTIHQKGSLMVARLFVEYLKPYIAEREDYGIGGMTMGADPIISVTAAMAHLMEYTLHPFYIRKEPKGHGTRGMLEGYFDNVKEAVMVEDTITTAGSLLKAVAACRENGIEVNRAVTIVDRLEGGKENCAREGVGLYAVFTIEDIKAGKRGK